MSETAFPQFAWSYFVLIFFVFGTLLGSFSNVVILRMSVGRSVIFPPSECPSCRHRLSPFDLIPIFGWILLRGKCRYCGVFISPQYPMVELVAGVILATSFASCGFTSALLPSAAWCIYWLIMAVLAFRGEVRKPAPFLWPLAFYPFFSWFATGQPLFGRVGIAVGGALLASIVAGTRSSSGIYRPAWFGVGAVGCLAMNDFIFEGSALLFIAAIIQILIPVQEETGPSSARLPLLFWSLMGLIICAFQGNFGFFPGN
ncbi:MAG: prepilin peptidase [Candidatus Riflebacteria bacterium]|nr:prepilin peptidase [Candidatus Riflebacteria bacterium]